MTDHPQTFGLKVFDPYEDAKLLRPFHRGTVSDGYHTFDELYEFRKVYNAALFNEWAKQEKYSVHKSKKHNDWEDCFGGGWFIVAAMLPTGQISNHYRLSDWDVFNIPEFHVARWPYDGHTSSDVLERMYAAIKQQQEDFVK